MLPQNDKKRRAQNDNGIKGLKGASPLSSNSLPSPFIKGRGIKGEGLEVEVSKPIVAIIGRQNVGKSTLAEALKGVNMGSPLA